MSGKEGRRVFHGTFTCDHSFWPRRKQILIRSLGYCAGLPRIVEDSLPDYLRSDALDDCGEMAEDDVRPSEWKLFGEYLESGARINVNVRSVF